MITHTQAYLILKKQSQDMFNFSVAVCYAMPALKEQIRLVRNGIGDITLLAPDHFKDSMKLPEVQARAIGYKLKLSQYIVLSSFSFFEAYIKTALTEMIYFHGGEDAFIRHAKKKEEQFILSNDAFIMENKRKLQEPEKPLKKQKYLKFSKELVKANYVFPSELLSSYGIRCLVNELKDLRSVEIPHIITSAIHCEIDSERFHQIRDIRNKIAHGDTDGVKKLTLNKAMKINGDLRNFASKIDRHLVEHFFVLEIHK
jgi:hypothetical protein